MNNTMQAFGLFLLSVGILLMAYGFDKRLDALESQQPVQSIEVLVGQDCFGATGPNRIMIAVEEDLLPQCEAIDVHTLVLE